MKTSILTLASLLSFNAFAAAGIPNLNCKGTIAEESVQLEYRDGGAAFMNVYAAEYGNISYIAVLNLSNPVPDTTMLPVTMLIGEIISGKVLVQRDVSFGINDKHVRINSKTEDGKRLTLTCIRFSAQ